MNGFRSCVALGLLVAFSQCIATAQDLVVRQGARTLEVNALTDEILRVRVYPVDERPRDESWAVAQNVRTMRSKAEITGHQLQTAKLVARIDPKTLKLRVEDASGHVIFAEKQSAEIEGAGYTLRFMKTLPERIFGMGDKTGGVDRRGKTFVNWNTDSYGFTSSDDPIYKSIPFFISSGIDDRAYGFFLDNTYRTTFDFGHQDPGQIVVSADEGPIDYYIIAGPSIAEVVRRYTDLTGKAPMPPKWIWGYQQSRWSYMSEAEVRELAAKLRSKEVPTDVIWLDIDFQDRNRPFTIDRKTFPEFEDMVQDLDDLGIKTVAIADLHVAMAPDQGYSPYETGLKGGHFLRLDDGETYVGPVWPGPAVFPEFTRSVSSQWWGQQFRQLLGAGVAGIWNDMNEPAIFESPTKTMPMNVRHRIEVPGFEPRTATHAEIHNVYGMENTHATFDGLSTLQPNERPFVMTRATYAGGQKYAVTWTGDNTSSWDHLKLAVSQTINLGLSGFSWTGTDVGGFTGGPSPELLTRWFQYATFAPIFRDHSQKDTPRAEPWVHGEEQLAIRRKFVEERYKLLPFLYALGEANSRTGDPMMRPIFYDYPGMLRADCDTSMQFTLGGTLLVAGSPKPQSPVEYKACLPKGGWYDYWDGDKVQPQDSGAIDTLLVTSQPNLLPVFIRAGSAIARQPLVQSTSVTPEGPLEIHIYPGEKGCSGTIYDDDGHSLDYRRGAFVRQEISCKVGRGGLASVTLSEAEGSFTPWWTSIRIVIHGGKQYTAHVGKEALAAEYGPHNTSFVVPYTAKGVSVRLSEK